MCVCVCVCPRPVSTSDSFNDKVVSYPDRWYIVYTSNQIVFIYINKVIVVYEGCYSG